MGRQTRAKDPVQMITAAQNVTASWADVGSEIPVSGWKSIGFFLDVDINDSNNIRFRLVGLHTTGGTEYTNMILNTDATAGAFVVDAEDEFVELGDDADQSIILQWSLDGLYPYVKLQVQAGTVGATAGQVDDAYHVIADN